MLIFLYKEFVCLHFSFILKNLKGDLLNNIILNNLLLLGGLSSHLDHLVVS